MSLNFGFSLPALKPVGGAGSNPFGQLGPTLDLSFVDGATGVTDLNDPNGYTLNTNFITPQYQVAAQYTIWETNVGLVDKTFSQIVTFSRTSGATWFNAAGNLIGVDFSTTSNTIGTGSKTFTLDATAGVNRSWATGDSVLISDQSNSANNMTGTVTSYTASTQVLVVDVTSTNGSGTIASWRVSSLMPRFDYSPSTLAAQGLLIEEARTNLCLQSADFSTTWSANNVTVTTNAVVSPDGTSNADSIFETVATAEHYVRQSFTGLTANSVYTITIFVRDLGGRNLRIRVLDTDNVSNGYQMAVSPSSGTVVQAAAAIGAGSSVSGTISAINNGWYRVTLSGNAGATCTKYLLDLFSLIGTTSNFAGDITKGITLFGSQLELGAFPTSYIPTTVAQVTRNADVASVNTLSPWFNASAGTLYAEATSTGYVLDVNFPLIASIDDGTNNNRITLQQSASVTSLTMNVRTASTSTTIADSGVDLSSVPRKIAGAYSGTSVVISVNGNAAITGTSNGVPSGLTNMKLGSAVAGYLSGLNGHLRRVTFYPRALSAAELQAITA